MPLPQRHSAGAHRYLDFVHCAGRGAGRLVHEPAHRHQRHLGGLPGHVYRDALLANGLLPVGLEEKTDQAAGLRGFKPVAYVQQPITTFLIAS